MDKKIFDENLRMYGGRYKIGCEYFDYFLESLMDDSQAFINKLETSLFDYVNWYKEFRDYSSIGHCSPIECKAMLYEKKLS